ncbi:MAG: hypothetical protein WDM79_13145 [Terricaulis sp.]
MHDPGAGEFVYATEPVRREIGPGQEAAENVHAERVVDAPASARDALAVSSAAST